MSQTSPASLWILWHPPAGEVVAAEWTIQPTSTRCKLLISAVTHGDGHLFLHRPDHAEKRLASAHQSSAPPTAQLASLSSLAERPSREQLAACWSSLDKSIWMLSGLTQDGCVTEDNRKFFSSLKFHGGSRCVSVSGSSSASANDSSGNWETVQSPGFLWCRLCLLMRLNKS